MSELLTQRTCEPCRVGAPRLSRERIEALTAQLRDGWRVVDRHHLEKRYAFDDFRGAMDFAVRVGELAEREGHHPDIHLAWGSVTLTIWTHKIDGLSESDFILAAKADEVR